MKFDRDIYFGLLCGGKVRRAVAYLRQFPEKASLAQRLERRMTQPPRLRTGSPWLNRILSCFARYYPVSYTHLSIDRSRIQLAD